MLKGNIPITPGKYCNLLKSGQTVRFINKRGGGGLIMRLPHRWCTLLLF